MEAMKSYLVAAPNEAASSHSTAVTVPYKYAGVNKRELHRHVKLLILMRLQTVCWQCNMHVQCASACM